MIFFFKQKTAYEMRISDWSSDVCSSDLIPLQEWKYFAFKAPKRKKYKDLDRQVDSFIKEERDQQKNFETELTIHQNDWVLFSLEQIGRASCRERVCQYV